jgi:hypothetical protein
VQLHTPTQEPDLGTALKVIYQWSYEPELEELRRLYVKGVDLQWSAEHKLPWETPIDMSKLESTPLSSTIPFERSTFFRSLPEDKRWQLARRGAAFRLSNFLHGEQGALLVAAQLVNAVPHIDAKFYAATQTMDEARHVEVFARYIAKLDCVRPIAPALKSVLDSTLSTGNWLHKLVGMQIVVEGLALFAFRRMRQMTQEPLLKELLTYVSQDEARHHAFGVQYIAACVPQLSAQERQELEDFALEAAMKLVGNANEQGLLAALLEAVAELGIDVVEMIESVRRERDELMAGLPRLHQLGPISGLILPTLERCGLLSERVATRYHSFLREGILDPRIVGESVQEFMRILPDLPEDTALWVLSEVD